MKESFKTIDLGRRLVQRQVGRLRSVRRHNCAAGPCIRRHLEIAHPAILEWTPPSRHFRMLGVGVGPSAWSALLSVARGGGQSAVARGCINTKSRDSIHSG